MGLLNGGLELVDLQRSADLYRSAPVLATLFFLSAMSLPGVPPLSGFFAKLSLVQGGLEAERYTIVVAALVVSLLTLLSMTKIWSEAFWKPAPENTVTDLSASHPSLISRLCLFGPTVLLAAITVGIGVLAGPVMKASVATAEQLLDSDAYIEAVLPEHRLTESDSLSEPRNAESTASNATFVSVTNSELGGDAPPPRGGPH